jgi:hypothetical protein
MDFDPEIKQPSAFSEVNQSYQSTLNSYDGILNTNAARTPAFAQADETGGKELEQYNQKLASQTLDPLIANTSYNPITVENALDEIGATQVAEEAIKPVMNHDGSIPLERYGEKGEMLEQKLSSKLAQFKYLFSNAMFQQPDEKSEQNLNLLLEDSKHKGLLSAEEISLFKNLRERVLDMENTAEVEAIFLAISDNESRKGYLDREIASNRTSEEAAVKLSNTYGLQYTPPSQRTNK